MITSTDDRSFCCGADIIEWSAMSPVEIWRTWIKPRPQNRVQRHLHHGRPQEDRSLHIRNEGKVRKFVDQVEHVTFSGRHARERSRNVKVVTERCVLQLGADGWIVTEIAPGVDFDRDVQARRGFRLHRSSDMRLLDPSLFVPEPINLKPQPAT